MIELLTIAGLVVGALMGVVVLWYLLRQGAFNAQKQTIEILKEQVSVLEQGREENRQKLALLEEKISALEAQNANLRELVTGAAKVDRLIEMYEEYTSDAQSERHRLVGMVGAVSSQLDIVIQDVAGLIEDVESLKKIIKER